MTNLPCRPRTPSPSERLTGALADLDRAGIDAYVPGEELRAVTANLRRALRDLGVDVEKGAGHAR